MYNQEPDLTREGGSIAVTLTFADALGVNVLLLPMGCGDDGAQYVTIICSCAIPDSSPFLRNCSSTDEKIDIRNFREGVSITVKSDIPLLMWCML